MAKSNRGKRMGQLRAIVSRLAAAAVAACLAHAAPAIVIQDDLTGTSSSLDWQAFNGACLTAGDGTGSIPACNSTALANYYANTTCPWSCSRDPHPMSGGTTGTIPDAASQGALRLSKWLGQNGAIVSNFTFPSDQGVNVVFTTVTYQGDSGGPGGDGADGISFYLLDGSSGNKLGDGSTVPSSSMVTDSNGVLRKGPGLGAWGGSLAYSCSNSNTPYDGVVAGYVGLGMDEYGNFLNSGDNTASGYNNGTQTPGRIGLRGAGSVSWAWLNTNYASLYPSSMSSSQRTSAVDSVCTTGKLSNGTSVMDYPAIPNGYKVLGAGYQIANEAAVKRTDATPITYNLQITQDGRLSLSFSYGGGAYQPVLTNQSITASNGPLPTDLRFAFAGSTGGSRNIHEITCFRATPAEQADSSAGINTQQAAQVQTGTQIYLSYFHTNNWWGQLTSQNLVYNSSTGVVSINASVNWDASCVLTGGFCAATNLNGTAQGSGSRQILTWNGSQGTPFQWGSLTTAQQNALDAGDATPYNSNRLGFLRGDRGNELTSSGSGTFRARTSVLGDIVHSTPSWVGPPIGPYGTIWTDGLYTTATLAENGVLAQSYPTFKSHNATRLNVVYSGSNDGMLHGFRSGSYDGNATASNPLGNYVTSSSTPNDGQEVLAYIPGAVVQSIHSTTTSVDYASPQYSHAFSVDATPGTGDLFYGNAWHTWLVGGQGPGGNAIYALDVTNPSNFSESNASSLVIGEWTPSTISCANVTGCGTSLGNTFGTPVIRRFHNGAWGFVFGNGLNSSSGHAGIYIVTVDPGTAAKSVYFLDTGYGPAQDPTGKSRADGIAFVTAADLDGDHIVDYVYAGDAFGNVWRFDLTANTASSWFVSTYNASKATPLFSTPNGQPITTRVLAVSAPASNGGFRVLVDFGTGQEIPLTVTTATTYASGTQSFYGIWDWDMSHWNAISTTDYSTLTGTRTISTSSLQSQTVTQLSAGTATTPGTRTVTSNSICWSGTSGCSSLNQYGWMINLPTSGEQVIYSPIIYNGAFIINTTVPPNNSPFACSLNLPTGWTMALSAASGGSFTNSFFADSNNHFVTVNGSVVSGIALNATGSPAVVTAVGNPYLVNQTSDGVGSVNQINPPGGTIGSRINWNELR
jgi:type IV pilus assembly protein PilY1